MGATYDFDKEKLTVTVIGDEYYIEYNKGKVQETTTINGKKANIMTVYGISFVAE